MPSNSATRSLLLIGFGLLTAIGIAGLVLSHAWPDPVPTSTTTTTTTTTSASTTTTEMVNCWDRTVNNTVLACAARTCYTSNNTNSVALSQTCVDDGIDVEFCQCQDV